MMDHLPVDRVGYRPPRNSDKTWTGHDGLHYRDLLPDEAALAIAAEDGSLTLTAYQQWVESGWKTPIGSLESSVRFAKKLKEEQIELLTAYLEHPDAPSDLTRAHLIEEAGDVAWVLTAIASNGGEGIARMTRLALGGDEATQNSLAINDLAAVTYPEFLTEEMPALVEARHPLVGFCIESLIFAYEGFEHHKIDGVTPLIQRDLATWGAQYAYKYPYLMAQLDRILREEGLSLGDAIANNIRKISHRRSINAIDKTDPGRL